MCTIKISFVIIVIFTCTNVWSQKSQSPEFDSILINTTVNENVAKYYSNIYKAEAFILKEKFSKASDSYFEAFRYLENPFQIDLYNALDCEVLSQKTDSKRLVFLVKQLMRKTGDKSIFMEDEMYKSIVDIPEISTILNNTNQVYNIEFIAAIDNMVERDQGIRKKSQNENNGVTYNSNFKDTIVCVDSLNYFALIELINNYGYISDELFGSIKNWGNLSLILRHNRSRREILPVLHKSVIAGKLDARLFSAVLGDCYYLYNGEIPVAEVVLSRGKSILSTSRFDKKTISQIDMLRKQIYLDDYKKQISKIVWRFRNPKYFFTFSSDTFLVYMYDDDLYKFVLENVDNKSSDTELYFISDEKKNEILKKAKEWEAEK